MSRHRKDRKSSLASAKRPRTAPEPTRSAARRIVAKIPQGIHASEPGRTMAGDVYERLRSDILSCHLAPGARLRFEEMRAIYKTGISPLREALIRLGGSGLVILEEHK